VFDDGTGPALVAGGNFGLAGGVPVNSIAKWDGTAWMAIGPGISRDVLVVTVFDDGTGAALYAAGGFRALTGRVSKWEGGASWTELGTGFGAGKPVNSLAGFADGTGPALYAGGFFTMASGVASNHIAKWGRQ
jgi:hypothetical protein